MLQQTRMLLFLRMVSVFILSLLQLTRMPTLLVLPRLLDPMLLGLLLYVTHVLASLTLVLELLPQMLLLMHKLV
jgi:hypothetical protein